MAHGGSGDIRFGEASDSGAVVMADNPVHFESTPAKSSMPGWYPELLSSVVERISTGRLRAHAAVNQALILTYWAIGRDVVERMDQEGWGARVVDRLSRDIREHFPDARGYSPRNLRYMRSFAQAWPEEAILQVPLARLPWYHQIALLEKLDHPDQRLWYAQEAIEHGWTRDVLAWHIDRKWRERSGKAVSNFAVTLPAADSDMAQQATKDPYVFDFIGLAEGHRERDIEDGLIRHVERFLLELGQGFAFVGRQLRLTINDSEFYADLVFYHYKLHAFVVIELKNSAFDPSFLGQLGMYVAAADDLLAGPNDGPTIGLILCKTKDNVIAEYALRTTAMPIGVAEWTDAITTHLPVELASALPRIEDIEAELADPPT